MTVVFFNPYADGEMKGAARRITFMSHALRSLNVPTRSEFRSDYDAAPRSLLEQLVLRLGLRRLGYFLHANRLCQTRSDLVVTEVIFAPTWRRNLALTIHDLKAFDAKATRGGKARRWAYLVFARLACQIVVVSESVRSDLVTSCGVDAERVQVIPNGISSEHLRLATETKSARKDYDFVYVSSFAPHKRHSLLLKAAPRGARIALVGRDLGSLAEAQAEARRRSDDLTVDFLDNIATDKELFAILGRSRCGVFPSVFEGFGIPILEYVASGLYVIASDIPPFLELADFVDRFVPADDIALLEAAMREFMEKSPPVNEDRARKLTDGPYTERAVAIQFLKLATGVSEAGTVNSD